jgi:alpha-L-rhamnosidase
VRESGFRISTGFVGTPLICDALCSVGEHNVAFCLLMEQGCPSWLYSVTMGATTIWERWDSLLPDGSVNTGEMTSFNHYALGAVADWVHRTLGGLAPAEPGYRRFDVRPVPGGGLTRARARHKTPYGLAECAWRLDGQTIEVEVVIPPNTTASVTLPGTDTETIEVGSGAHHWSREVPAITWPLVSLDSTLSALMEDMDAWTVVTCHAPELAGAGGGPGGFGAMSLRQLFSFRPLDDEARDALGAALAELNQERELGSR